MKIAFIFPPIWPLHLDGSLQIWNREITGRMSKTCEVTVYSGSFPADGHGIADDGVTYRCLLTRWDSRLLKVPSTFLPIASAAHEKVCKEFSYESVCSLPMEVYQDVLSCPFGPREAEISFV